jgi:predicted AlkP superfamily pyrophosphatase or phosphodiesterase
VNPEDRLLIAAISKPATLLKDLEPNAGEYMMGNETTISGDEIKTRYTVEILRRLKPGFMTLHLSSLDDTQHAHGPFSAEACADLEALDGMVARLTKAAVEADPAAVMVLVSDHGFMTITHLVNLNIPFLQAGLVQATINPTTKAVTISAWKAEPWGAGGMAAIMLKDANDHETEQQVKAMLDKLAADPENGIAQVLNRDEIRKRGAFPDAAFLVVLKPVRGSHGFSPEYPEMRASFFAVGAGIARNRNLGVVDMRQIAPTVAKILKVQMPTAKEKPLHVEP